MTTLRHLVIAAVLCASSTARADRVIHVGTYADPPFVIKTSDGEWTGIAIELLRAVATEMGATIDVRELTPDALTSGPQPGIDVIALLNVNQKLNARFDLSHGFYSTGLAIAVPEPQKESFFRVIARIFSGGFVWIALGVIVLLGLVGLLMWWIERRPIEPLPKEKAALSKALFWAFEPVIGYKASQHVTRAGRILGTIWGLFGVVLVSGLTANLAAQLTAHRLAPSVRGPDDLPRVRVGIVVHTAGKRFCDRRGIRRREFGSLDDAFVALEHGDVDAVVDDQPDLQYGTRDTHTHLQILPGTFLNHDYAFGLQVDSPIRKEFNAALLKAMENDSWTSLLATYLGKAD